MPSKPLSSDEKNKQASINDFLRKRFSNAGSWSVVQSVR